MRGAYLDGNCSPEERKTRTQWWGKLDTGKTAHSKESRNAGDATNQYLLNTDGSATCFASQASDADRNALLNNLISGNALTSSDGFHGRASVSDDDDEPANVMSWTESPQTSDKLIQIELRKSQFCGLNIHRNIHHRRRSSQVAEQVWRMRQKKQAQGLKDENLYSSDKEALSAAIPVSDEHGKLKIAVDRLPILEHSLSQRKASDSGHLRHTGALLARFVSISISKHSRK
ncbi:unnamed protein product [Gongylonema pulchrum]|uniref:Uncharacterized protein n=1 Tax=Gongylonema pulchrum TaxID=637853 RepID=A0A183CYY3_9BILA|nr:unnamed protein product [Gongylonema pulchrum]